MNKSIIALRMLKSAESLITKTCEHENETEKSLAKECGITAERY